MDKPQGPQAGTPAPPEKTILEAAVDQAEPLLFRSAASAHILTLLLQVGQLEERNASLENGVKVISAMCYWRATGYCSLNCQGRVFCDTEGLTAFTWPPKDSPSPRPSPIKGEGEVAEPGQG